ncbi:FAD-dependent monooxygenase [Paraglaciecola sp. L1A13]|uniref:FAD-dependent monooxygenase n=1 Tax=Paraglaciecola sp. L1A13 TaxID=2686359 RepID=UPI00131C1E6C|nr:FAD-dependent monooxygenase [Paraglaciecola sp. L1A13]
MAKNVIVAGGGIGGLSTALALRRKGFEVLILEQSDALSEVGAGIQLSPNAMHVLIKLGVSEALISMAFFPEYATMRHYLSGHEYLRMPLGKRIEQKYNAPYLHIHRADLHSVLHQAALKRGITITLKAQVKRYQHTQYGSTTKVQVELHDGRKFTCDMLVGADGIRSAVKKCLLPNSSLHFTGHVAWRGTLKSKNVPVALVKPDANLWIGPSAHLVNYYVRGGEEINIIAVQERKEWNDERWNIPGDVVELRRTFEKWHPQVTELLSHLESCFLWGLFGSEPLDKWVDNHVALIGDACHPMLPFVAQGAAMAIEDGFCLAKWVSTEIDIHQGLALYQADRFGRATRVQKMAKSNADLYHMNGMSAKIKLKALEILNALSPRLASLPIAFIYAHNVTLD